MLPGGRRRTSADVARLLSSCDSRETNVVTLPPSLAEPVQLSATTKNEETTIQSRRLVLRVCEVARLPRFLGTRTFRLSKRLLRHFFHRKEFRRKRNAVGRRDVCRIGDDERAFVSRESHSRKKSGLRASYLITS
jgi:hypothetical protein